MRREIKVLVEPFVPKYVSVCFPTDDKVITTKKPNVVSLSGRKNLSYIIFIMNGKRDVIHT